MKKNITIISFCFLLLLGFSILLAMSDDYSVRITRKGQDLYKVDNSSIYIKTRYCYEYPYGEDAILKYSGYGYNKGKLIFKNGKQYDIEEIFEGVEAKRGTMALTRRGNIEEVEIILVPTTLR